MKELRGVPQHAFTLPRYLMHRLAEEDRPAYSVHSRCQAEWLYASRKPSDR
jgi:hypothetical protein